MRLADVGPHPGAGRKPKGLRAGVSHAGRIDPFSSGAQFYGWSAARWRTSVYPNGYEPAAIAAPLTWMLGVGYLRGRPIGVFTVPSRRATQ